MPWNLSRVGCILVCITVICIGLNNHLKEMPESPTAYVFSNMASNWLIRRQIWKFKFRTWSLLQECPNKPGLWTTIFFSYKTIALATSVTTRLPSVYIQYNDRMHHVTTYEKRWVNIPLQPRLCYIHPGKCFRKIYFVMWQIDTWEQKCFSVLTVTSFLFSYE